MNDIDLKNTLIKALELDTYELDNKQKILSGLLKSNFYIEYTSIFTRREWNTYCAVLHIQVPVGFYKYFASSQNTLLSVADKIFGKQDDYFLTEIEIGILATKYEVIDFSNITITDIISKAIEDAELFMQNGKYDSAFDRVHTAFHGYLRKKLDDLGVEYEESDTLNQLYNKLHADIEKNISADQSGIIKTALRSGSGMVSSINDLRNRFSLAHPNKSIISSREAEMCIKMIKVITDYIEKAI